MMSVRELRVQGYRSIRDVEVEAFPLTVFLGPNGSGKTNLYRSISLLAAAARGELAHRLAKEGGIPSVAWAGPRRHKKPVRVAVGVALEDFDYQLALGPPPPALTAFALDPEIKTEVITPVGRPRTKLMERHGESLFARDGEGRRREFPMMLRSAEAALVQVLDPQEMPVVAAVRQELAGWRFYHQFRTDERAPSRRPQIGVRTWRLHADGRDLAAALQTIIENGNEESLRDAIDEAFPGARLRIGGGSQRFAIALEMPGLLRPLEASELSDGTLRYLCLLAALETPDPPMLMAFNEPEASLHPALVEPLARRLAAASRRGQVWVTTHSETLAEVCEQTTDIPAYRLEKVEGETRVVR